MAERLTGNRSDATNTQQARIGGAESVSVPRPHPRLMFNYLYLEVFLLKMAGKKEAGKHSIKWPENWLLIHVAIQIQ